jgi:hypothetical protein
MLSDWTLLSTAPIGDLRYRTCPDLHRWVLTTVSRTAGSERPSAVVVENMVATRIKAVVLSALLSGIPCVAFLVVRRRDTGIVAEVLMAVVAVGLLMAAIWRLTGVAVIGRDDTLTIRNPTHTYHFRRCEITHIAVVPKSEIGRGRQQRHGFNLGKDVYVVAHDKRSVRCYASDALLENQAEFLGLLQRWAEPTSGTAPTSNADAK